MTKKPTIGIRTGMTKKICKNTKISFKFEIVSPSMGRKGTQKRPVKDPESFGCGRNILKMTSPLRIQEACVESLSLTTIQKLGGYS